MTGDEPRVHNRFKLPFVVVCFLGGIALVVGGVVAGYPGLVVPGAVAVLGAAPVIWVIVTGRGNPWWMRSPLDPSPAGESSGLVSEARAFLNGRGGRVLAGFVLLVSVGFVLAGTFLVVKGAVTGRGFFIFVGAVGAVFFGTGAWIGAAILRRSV